MGSQKFLLICATVAQFLVISIVDSEKPSGSRHIEITTPSETVFTGSTALKLSYRLPLNVKPVGYRLNLTTRVGMPGETNLDYQGIVEIDATVEEATDSIALHSKNLNISKYHVMKHGEEKKFCDIKISVDSERDFLILEQISHRFTIGMYTIAIEYTGQLRLDSRGFSVDYYQDDDGRIRGYAVTHFEPVHARTAFPCFDEPSFKAKFNISITHYKDYSANSNSPKISTSVPDDEGMVTTVFAETPKMSTYLVAFLVSDFESIEDNEGKFRVLARPNAIRNASFALQMGKSIMNELENFTGIPYFDRLRKIDQVAVNRLGESRGMENWGLITYREEVLFHHGDDVGHPDNGKMIALLIAHEFAHQWFGNLVSPKWWKYTWLKEGFATFFESFIIAKIKPEWRTMEYAVIGEIWKGGLEMDGFEGPALNSDSETVEDIKLNFGDISYAKGAAVVRMMQHFLTDSIFQRGLQNYLDKKKDDCSDSDDLFQLIDEVAMVNRTLNLASKSTTLGSIMDTWVNRAGYPLITVTRNYKNNSIHLKQECFTLQGTKDSCTNIWNVPISYSSPKDMDFNNTTAQVWLTDESATINVDVTPRDWILLNKQATGYYRVNYDETNWHLIIKYLKSSEKSRNSIHVLNRAKLIDDAFALLRAGKLSLSILLELITVWENETDDISWIPAIDVVWWLNRRLGFTGYHKSFKEYFRRIKETMNVQLIETIKKVTELDLVTDTSPAMRSIFFPHKDCSDDHDLRNLLQWIVDKNSSSSPMIPCCDYRKASDDQYNQIASYITQNNTISDSSFQDKVLCLSNPKVLRDYLSFTARNNSQPQRPNESPTSGILDVPEMDFIIIRLLKILRNTLNKPDALIDFVSAAFTTRIQLNKLKEINEGEKGLQKSWTATIVAKAEKRVRWLEENQKILIDWTQEIDQKLKTKL
ncbi:hypothetical protein QAD02_006069 [Eretmocerus hayati]|uniref:Uncharacterized protein n=1 Tax=Eretmocerus hayati TaxID=131215 RepID=A0ACC2N245_9HYME|nr:hypothetical protein QAD02_006069 [Eretmocerus hayati]